MEQKDEGNGHEWPTVMELPKGLGYFDLYKSLNRTHWWIDVLDVRNEEDVGDWSSDRALIKRMKTILSAMEETTLSVCATVSHETSHFMYSQVPYSDESANCCGCC